jgi:hypothetical protein
MNDEVLPPSEDDLVWLQQAEAHIVQLLIARYDDVHLEHSEADLQLAQRLLDDNAVRREDTLELQCLGVMLGNVFAANTSMRWAGVENEFGKMLALHSDEIKFMLYPLTMISKRVEDGRKVDMPGLYRSFVNDLGLAQS